MEKKLKILIADDNQKICEMIAQIIEKEEEMEVVNIATDGDSEIKMIEEYKPDVVITDLRRKQGITGLQIIDMYSKKEQKPIFFVISAELLCNISPIFKKYNIKYYENKPFDEENIKSKLYEIKSELFPSNIISINNELVINEKYNFIKNIIKKIYKKFFNY